MIIWILKIHPELYYLLPLFIGGLGLFSTLFLKDFFVAWGQMRSIQPENPPPADKPNQLVDPPPEMENSSKRPHPGWLNRAPGLWTALFHFAFFTGFFGLIFSTLAPFPGYHIQDFTQMPIFQSSLASALVVTLFFCWLIYPVFLWQEEFEEEIHLEGED